MPVISEKECKALGGEVLERPAPPTWKAGEKLKICRIDISKVPELALEWQKRGQRVIILGKE